MAKLTGLSGGLVTICNNVASDSNSGSLVYGREGWTFDMSQDIVEAADFSTSGFTEKFQGLRDASGSISGFMDPADTDGLKELISAWWAGDDVGLKLWVDHNNDRYVYCEALITGPGWDVSVGDMASMDIDFEVSNLEEEWLTTAFE